MKEKWTSKLGFILAAAGSAVGLANIWRFPHLVGSSGGAAFILLYIFCLLLIGVPVFLSELLIGRESHSGPSRAFANLSGSLIWGKLGKLTVVTGFLVSTFYSAVAAWILGFFIEALLGNLHSFTTAAEAKVHYDQLMASPAWGLFYHFLFMLLSTAILILGVRAGIEKSAKWMMPLLFILLVGLVIKGLTLEHSFDALAFLFQPNWQALTPAAALLALGQSFFTLSIGQGTMVTYGSYLEKNENIVKSSLQVALVDTVISILAAIAVFTIVFSVQAEPGAGEGLIFLTLPLVFSQLSSGYFLAVAFFLLVTIAAITSQISALEPSIAYLVEEKGFSRQKSALLVCFSSFLVGIPSALSSSLLADLQIGGHTFLSLIEKLCSLFLIPLGGLLAVLLVGWKWGRQKGAIERALFLEQTNLAWIEPYFIFCVKYSAPFLIVIVFLNAIGVI